MRIDIVNFGGQKFRYLPMVELFLADALTKRGVEEVYIHTLMKSEKFGPLMDTLCANDGPVIFWESLSSKSVYYISNGMDFCREFTNVSERPTFFGGYWASTVADRFPDFKIFDSIIRGYGIEVITDVLMSGTTADIFIDATVPCDWNAYNLALDCLVSPKKYYRESDRFLSGYISSFACPNKCGFCYNSVLKKVNSDYASRNLDKVLADIDALDELYSFERVQFKDLNFFHETERAFSILEYLRSKGKVIQRALDLHVNQASEGLFARAAHYGISELWIGLETFSPNSLTRMDKEYDTSKINDIFKWADRYNIEVYGNIMLGFPWQNKNEVDSTISIALDCINRHEHVRIMFNAVRPVIGSPIQQQHFDSVLENRSFDDMVDAFSFRISSTQSELYGLGFDFIDIEKTHKAFFLINRFASIALHSGPTGKWILKRLSLLIITQLKPPYFSFEFTKKFFLMEIKKFERILALLRTIFIAGNRTKFCKRICKKGIALISEKQT
ncbi:MAG: radical SAM protein [Desulfobacterales bacterium]|nr:radical SAM protein [Desulfobacterales bacterium]